MRDDYEVQLRVPVRHLAELEEWLDGMNLPTGQTILQNDVFHFIVFSRLNDKQAALFKLRWA